MSAQHESSAAARPVPREIVVCLHCNVVLFRDGNQVQDRPTSICSHLRGATYLLDAVVHDG